MGCIAVPVADERADPAFARATLVLDTLLELDERWLDDHLGHVAPADETLTGDRG
jgi:hypothetical protein